VALAFRTTIDLPQRFRQSVTVAPHLGSTPKIDETPQRMVVCDQCVHDVMATTGFDETRASRVLAEIVVRRLSTRG
jgi:hypothetical protein